MPNAAAWFLLSLISWRIILQILPNRWIESKWILPVSVLVSLLAGFVPVENELSLQRTLAFLPFFICGYLLRGKINFEDVSQKKHILSAVVFASFFVASCFFLNRDISYVCWCKTDYYTSTRPTFVLMALRALFLLVASMMVICILILFPKVNKPTFLSRLGSDTMFYYVYHIIVMRVGIIMIRQFHLPLSFLAIAGYTLLSLFVLYFLGKIKLFRWLLNPISSICKSAE